MKIISDHFGWLFGDGKRSICNIPVQSMLESRTKTRTTNAIDQTWLQGPRRMDHRVTVKTRHDMTHNINSRSIAGRDQQPTRRSCKEYENK